MYKTVVHHTENRLKMIIIHSSWDFFKPNENEKPDDFKLEEYYKRVIKNDKFKHIPKLIFEEWIYGLNQNYTTKKNYGWIDYETINFKLVEWSTESFMKLYVIDEYQEYYTGKKNILEFENITSNPDYLSFWKNYGTWITPPIILDVKSMKDNIPIESDIKGEYQLVEGHSRVGILNSLMKIKNMNPNIKIADKHKTYLMTK